MALIAGLLHDVGQFWFYSLDSERYRECWSVAMKTLRPIEQVEMEMFGVDHSTLGEWLAVHWGLPAEVCIAIGAHHMPNVALHQSMVPLVHVAEVICNALGLMGEGKSHVHYLSEPACKTLGIEWNQDVREIFGRIEARSQHANAFFG